MNWLFLALVSALFYGGYNSFLKISSGHIHQVLGAVVLQLTALFVGTAVLLFLRSSGHPFELNKTGVIFAALGGMCVASGEIVAFHVFSRDVPTAIGVPVIVGGTVAAATLFGLVFLRESLSIGQSIGILFVVAGIVLLTASKPITPAADNKRMKQTAQQIVG